MRLTKIDKKLEAELKAQNLRVLKEWVKLQTEDMEKKLRFSKEETQILQGALRVLDDIADIL